MSSTLLTLLIVSQLLCGVRYLEAMAIEWKHLFLFFVSLDLLHNQLITHSIRTLIQNSGTPTIQCKQDHYLKHFMSLCGPLFRQDCKCKLSILEGPHLAYWKFALQQAMSAVLGILSLYLTCAGKEYFYCIYKQNRNINKLSSDVNIYSLINTCIWK